MEPSEDWSEDDGGPTARGFASNDAVYITSTHSGAPVAFFSMRQGSYSTRFSVGLRSVKESNRGLTGNVVPVCSTNDVNISFPARVVCKSYTCLFLCLSEAALSQGEISIQ